VQNEIQLGAHISKLFTLSIANSHSCSGVSKKTDTQIQYIICTFLELPH